MSESVVVVSGASRAWRRRLGAVAWAALEDLALAARRDHAGWVAPVGVRDVAAGIGINKDTAARAVAALGAAGLVTLTRVAGRDGVLRSGYRLHLPDGIELQLGPKNVDSRHEEYKSTYVWCHCPNNADKAPPSISGSGPVERGGRAQVGHPGHVGDVRAEDPQ